MMLVFMIRHYHYTKWEIGEDDFVAVMVVRKTNEFEEALRKALNNEDSDSL